MFSIHHIQKPMCEVGYNQDRKRHFQINSSTELWTATLKPLACSCQPFTIWPRSGNLQSATLLLRSTATMQWSHPKSLSSLLPQLPPTQAALFSTMHPELITPSLSFTHLFHKTVLSSMLFLLGHAAVLFMPKASTISSVLPILTFDSAFLVSC